jgi:DNA-binding GntR family transcriptional regulator
VHRVVGMHIDGGDAERVSLPAATVEPIPAGVGSGQAAAMAVSHRGSARARPLRPRGPHRGRALTRPPRRDAVAHAHARLRALIVRGAIAPGSELSQVELARRVGVSTTPLREALRRLEAEGLIDSQRHRRPRVRPFKLEELDSIYAARIMLECLALRLTVPEMTARQLGSLQGTVTTMAGANHGGGATAIWENAHLAFHQALVAGAAPALKVEIDNLMARGDRYVRLGIGADTPSVLALVDAEHASIEQACQEHNAIAAASLLGAHLAHAAHTIGSYIAPGSPLPSVEMAARTRYVD